MICYSCLMEDHLEHMGVGVVIVDPQTHKILLGERKNAYKSGYFGLPGGRTEIAETVKNSAIREVAEETGLAVKDLEYVGVVRELQDGYNFINFGILVTSFEGKVENKEPHKCKEWEWYSANDLPEKILLAHKIIIEMNLGKVPDKLVDLGHE